MHSPRSVMLIGSKFSSFQVRLKMHQRSNTTGSSPTIPIVTANGNFETSNLPRKRSQAKSMVGGVLG
jgi:hypothetical protein